MAASKDETNRKLTFRLYQDGDHKWRSQGENIFLEDTSHKCPTYVHRTPPCQGSCPSGEDIRGWLDIVRGIEKPPEGVSMQEYAFQRSTDANPFPSMMGRVCPAGLAAAYQLRRRGIASTIFDEHEELGGMFRYGIPGYRTTREFLDHEINRIVEMDNIDMALGDH